MALLFTSPITALASHQRQSLASEFAAYPVFRLPHISIALKTKSYFGGEIQAPSIINTRGSFTVKASSEIDGAESVTPDPPTPPPSGSNQESTPVENLPLESKLQLKLEQKMKMKLAKKIRLRRKRLVRKRHLRKKGRWPPSKMKKNKNV